MYSKERLREEKAKNKIQKKIESKLQFYQNENVEESQIRFEDIMIKGIQVLKLWKIEKSKRLYDDECGQAISDRGKTKMNTKTTSRKT